MASTTEVVKLQGGQQLGGKSGVEAPDVPKTSEPNPPVSIQPPTTTTTTSRLALVPMRSAAKNSKQQQQQHRPLEVKQFPIVLGRTNLSQWWYQSCDCQQYYCRLHCRPVAQNIGSLSKVMIQVDTKGVAHIVGKNPHLVTIITPERSSSSNNNNASSSSSSKNNTNTNDAMDVDEEGNTNKEKSENSPNKDDYLQPIVLRPRDILSIGRRDREPWMRFQIVETDASTSSFLAPRGRRVSGTNVTNTVPKQRCSKPAVNSVACKGEGLAANKTSPEAPRQQQQQQQQPSRPAQNDQQTQLQAPVARPAEAASPQPRNSHHDAQLPEWITTTTTTRNTGVGKRNKSSSFHHNNYDMTDTKQQQQHQAMVGTLTKAAAAASAAAEADERNKSKKHYRYNSYYNYYNYDTEYNTQRKRRRHNASSSAIRSAEDLYNNSASRRGLRLQGHYQDSQIHLVFQDYETSARLVRQGTRWWRSEMKAAKEANGSGEYNDGSQQSQEPQRKHARTDRNFIGKPKEKTSVAASTNAAETIDSGAMADGVEKNEELSQQQSKSMGMLSRNYAAALMEVVSAPSVSTSGEQKAGDCDPSPGELQGDQPLQPEQQKQG